MDSLALAFALVAGLLVSLLPTISSAQGAGLDRQIWLIILGHAAALVVIAAAAVVARSPLGGPRFVLIAALSGACNGLNGAIYYAAVMRRGPVSISWTVVWMSAVIVAALGWVLVGEPIYLTQPFALACFAACLGLMGWSTYLHNRRAGSVLPIQRGFWLWLVSAMAAGVAGVVLIKIRPEGGGHLAFAACLLGGLVAAMAAFAAVRRIPLPRDRRTLWTSLAWAGVIGPNFLLVVAGLKWADVSVFQPVQAGTALAAGVAWVVLRGERPSRLVLLGAALAVASIVLINLKWGLLVGR